MIHLLIATPSHALHGGVERIIESLARALPAHGFRVTVALARGVRWNQPDRYRREYPDLETIEIDGTSGTRVGRLRALDRVLQESKPDVVLIARLFDAYEAVRVRKALGQRLALAVTIQAYEPEYLADLASYAPIVDCCVTSGRLIAAAATQFAALDPARVMSVPGGVRAAERSTERPPSGPIRLGYVGRLDQPQKRVLDLAETLRYLRELDVPFTCRVVGTGDAERDLRRALSERGLADAVSFEGWKTTEQLYDHVYPTLDVLLHFAQWEGITIAPREAMAHGVVPVISQFLGLRTEGHFRDGENCLSFPVGDVAMAAQRVQLLAKDAALWLRLSTAAGRSEEGVWSDLGALEAWAGALSRSLTTAGGQRAIPSPLNFPASGRIGRWLGEPAADRLRAWVGRTPKPAGPGDEWPHCSGLASSGTLAEIRHFAEAAEA